MAGIGHCLYEREKEHAQRNSNYTIPHRKHIDGLRHKTSGLCEKTNSIYIVFYLLYTTMSKWSECAHASGVTCVCARSGSRLTEGVSEAWCWGNCHRSCRFWSVYSRIMMTYFKQTRLLSSLYLYTSAPCIRFIHL